MPKPESEVADVQPLQDSGSLTRFRQKPRI